ncbi:MULTISPECIES: HK97 family phage prohead protease [Sphingobacterium]|uniref:HK97 family phage prohead protease n=1 Tax=Sphingobacterium TaxID=28453 RepID=UPI00257D9616|nr:MULTISPECIES: HK97 family phage prohead protease [Sphingobacterium]
MTHKFIVNTNDVNAYGYRVLTEGIDYVQYMKNAVVYFGHDRFLKDERGSEVIGRCLSLSKEGDKLIAEIEFDIQDDFAKKIAEKVERGYIRMASIYADIISTSTEPSDLLPGQSYETVTKCKLIEISIVDIGGNDGALKLSRNGSTVQLSKLEIQNPKTMSFKTIAIALGLIPDADESAILAEITKVKLSKTTAETQLETLKKEVETGQMQDATVLVEKAIQLNLIPEALKDAQLSAFKSDFNGQKVTLSRLIAEKEGENGVSSKVKLVKDFVSNGKNIPVAGSGEYQKGDFVKLSKENPNELIRLRNEEPEVFKAMYKAEYNVEPKL